MIHKDDFGNFVGTIPEWGEFYKWATSCGMLYSSLEKCIEEYLKHNSNGNS